MQHSRPAAWPARTAPCSLALALLATATAAPAASAQSVRWTVMPSASYVRWHENLGLDDATLLGGRVGMDFGDIVGLEGFYLTQAGDISADLDFLPGSGSVTGSPTLSFANYGLGLRLNFGGSQSRVAPFLRGGTSVFRFRPQGRDASQFLALTYGGGLRFNLTDRLRAQISVEDARLRLDRAALAPEGTTTPDPERDRLRSNLTFGAGLGVALGPPLLQDGRGSRWNTVSFPIEPFVGRLGFDDGALPNQSLAGVRLGIDASALVGLRGYYWRGVSPSFGDFEPVHSIGGEAQFNLNRAPLLAPYLVLGGGTIDFRESFVDEDGASREDQTVLIVGGGLGIRLSDQFRLNVAARDYVYSRDRDLEDVSRANQLSHNWLFSAGLTLNVGRGTRGVRIVRNATRADSLAARLAAVEEAVARDSAVRVARGAHGAPRRRGDTVTVRDTVYVREGTGDVELSPATAPTYGESSNVRQSFVSGRTVMIPVPAEGELYIRYGPPGQGATMLQAGPGAEALRPSAAGAAAERAAGTIAVPMRRDASGRLVADTAALRTMVRRMIQEERRAAAGQERAGDPPSPLRAAPPAARDSVAPRAPTEPGAAAARSEAERRADSLLVRELWRSEMERERQREMERELEREIDREVERRVVEQLQREAQRPAQPPYGGAPTAFLRDAPVVVDRAGAAALETLRLTEAERERTQADVSRLRARVDELDARRDSAAAAAVRAELRQAEAAAERAQAEAEAAAEALRAAEHRATEAADERTASLQALQRLVADVAEVRDADDGLLVVLGDGAFATGSASLAPRAHGALGVVAAALVQYPAERIVITGHTDATGAASTNLRLSERRALAVRDALLRHAVAPEQVEVRAYGETMPVASNATKEGRARNRRAELLLVGSELATVGAGIR